MYLPEQLQHGEDGVRQEGEPENQVNLLVHNVHWQGAHSRHLWRGWHLQCTAQIVNKDIAVFK